MFIDIAKIKVKAGDGGDGAVHAAAHGHKYTLGHKWVPPEKADGAPVV